MATFLGQLESFKQQQREDITQTKGGTALKILDDIQKLQFAEQLLKDEVRDLEVEGADYQEAKGNIDMGQSLLGLFGTGGRAIGSILGAGLKRNLKKPELTLDFEQSIPGFDKILFGQNKYNRLMSAYDAAKEDIDRIYEGSLLEDLSSSLMSEYAGFNIGKRLGLYDSEDTFLNTSLLGNIFSDIFKNEEKSDADNIRYIG